MERKRILCMMLMLVMAIAPVMAQEAVPRLKTIVVLGKGLAISQTDPKDFKILKVGIARVRITLAGEETEVEAGVLHLDEERYKLKDLVIENGTVSGGIYINNTQVGSFEASSMIKGNLEVWVGTLTVEEKTWNIYILGAPRWVKPPEMGEKISELCKMRPEICRKLVKGIGPGYCERTPDDPSCREKIRNWCKENPKDERCIALFRRYCRFHIEDIRCRQALKEFCAKNPEEEECKFFELKVTEKFCEKHPLDRRCLELQKKRIVEYCIDHPEDERCIAFKNAREFVERARLAVFCRNNPTEERCEKFCENHPIACRTPPTIPQNVTTVPIERIMKRTSPITIGPLPMR